MPLRLVSRPGEDGAVAAVLDRASVGPSGLVLEGEAGIGKTTVWFHALDLARQRGFTVLSARTAETESVLAYAGLADLLGGVDGAVWDVLPPPLRRALERVLLYSDDGHEETDQRAVAAGFLLMTETMAQQAPVLLAIDDLQWLDASSVQAVAFAARRLRGRVGVLATERVERAGGSACSWLQLPQPEALTRIWVQPLSLGGLTAVVSDRLGRSVSRPKMVRIAEISGGNPFYALELARLMGAGAAGAATTLPSTLAELVRTRVGSISPEVSDLLLAAACVTSPTIELVAGAVGEDAERVAKMLDEAADQGLVSIEGQQIRFTHPLLASGVYTKAARSRRRALHRRLARLVDEPELQARHLALASVHGDPKTLATLDKAARIARARGAPAAAAELLDLALGLGGDTPERQMRSAQYHCDAGDFTQAQGMLEAVVDSLAPGVQRAEALSRLAAVAVFGSNFRRAAELLQRALLEVGDDTALQAQILLTLAFAEFNSGRMPAAAKTVESAVTVAAAADQPELLCQALSLRTNQRFLRGEGVDEESLARALELERADLPMPMAFRPSVQNASFLSWTGALEAARAEYAQLQQRCIERGEENDLLHLTFNSFQVEVWLGNLTGAAEIARDSMDRARQLSGDLPLGMALTMRALLAALAGREADARADAGAALAASMRCGAHILAVWPLSALGMLEVSLGNYDSAVDTLKPLLAQLDAM
ncbi:MAG: AAA family ATPase, partial [Actinomycetota bacterium]|nr:AAA family ATPase [Actinomycetota bacterium]